MNNSVTFNQFRDKVAAQFDMMSAHTLYNTDTDGSELSSLYLTSFKPEDNPMFRERTENDCQCCTDFLRKVAGVVAYVDGKRVSIWDIEDCGKYQNSVNALREVVSKAETTTPFYHYQFSVGTHHNFELGDSTQRRWDHFFVELPARYVMPEDAIASHLSKITSYKDVFLRGLEELSVTSCELVIDLIGENSLYRGEEMLTRLEDFVFASNGYQELKVQNEDTTEFLWSYAQRLATVCRFRNSSIGTLITDLSDGMDLEDAVNRFEHKVSEGNYKRTSSVATKGMIEKAKKAFNELGLEGSEYRRYAKLTDLTINNVIFANRDAKQSMNPFDTLASKAPAKKRGKGTKESSEMGIVQFLDEVVPFSTNIEVLVENKHLTNLFSLIAPVDSDAGNMLAWDNNFSWSYNGEVTDSLREQVEKTGGNVDGILRCSLRWENSDDLDIRVIQPDGSCIDFQNPRSYTGGKLDIDANMSAANLMEIPVENIFWKKQPLEGNYIVEVTNYNKRTTSDQGYEVEVATQDSSHMFESESSPANRATHKVVSFNYNKVNGIRLLGSKFEGVAKGIKSKSAWNLTTQQFHKVDMVMLSPNFWDENKSGNKHYFFSIVGCVNEKESRGIYSEYLSKELYPHRKVFEMLGSQLKVPKCEEQVSGLGFSSTKRNEAQFKVDGRIIKVLF